MQILIDNRDLFTTWGISVLDYSGVFDFAAERVSEREWFDKSGVDKNLENIRFDTKEFVFTCFVKAANESAAYNQVSGMINYMFDKGVFVLSLRDLAQGIRQMFLCERSNTVVSTINIRKQNSLYQFKLGLKDVNPNCIKYTNTVAGLASTINYTKGQTAVIYWGNGDRGQVSNSGNYTKSDYATNGIVDIIIDLDANAAVVIPLTCDFSGTPLTGAKPLSVQFTNSSSSNVVIWAWDFGDGGTSAEKSPLHVYDAIGTYTVVLQVFNDAKGSAIRTKTDYVTVRNSYILKNSTDIILKNNTDKIVKI